MVLITLGVLALVFEPILNGRVAEKEGREGGTEGGGGGTEFGGVVLVGPIPIIFGSSPRGALMAAAVAIIVLVLVLLLVLA
jgi:uncharacterized protein (TIGR00304 family)